MPHGQLVEHAGSIDSPYFVAFVLRTVMLCEQLEMHSCNNAKIVNLQELLAVSSETPPQEQGHAEAIVASRLAAGFFRPQEILHFLLNDVGRHLHPAVSRRLR